MHHDDTDQLDRMEKSLKRIEGAVFGDEEAGLEGVVRDIRSLKAWRWKVSLGLIVVACLVIGNTFGLREIIPHILKLL